jgi:hypothetical protein
MSNDFLITHNSNGQSKVLKQLPTTHATSKLGKGVELKNGFVLAEKSNNRKKLIY